MKRQFFLHILAGWLLMILSGCLYPQSEMNQQQAPNQDQLELVQTAIDNYHEQNDGLLPIKTKPSETPIFEKYLVDFNTLKDNHYLTNIPSNAFEQGGIYQYIIITPEENPRVRLLDLRLTDEIRKVVTKLHDYRSEYLYPPFGQQISKGVYTINYDKLGLKHEPYVVSPYSQKNLPLIMDTNGNIYIDYRIDLQIALNEYDHQFVNGDDIRYLIAENTPFVPAYSLPYTVEDNEPIFMYEP